MQIKHNPAPILTMNVTFENLIKIINEANCSYTIIPIYYETVEGEGIEDTQDQLSYNGFTNINSLSNHLKSLLDHIKQELITTISNRAMPKNNLLNAVRQSEIACKEALNNFYTFNDNGGKTYYAHKAYKYIADNSTAHLPPLDNTDFSAFHETVYIFLAKAIEYYSDLVTSIALNYLYEKPEVVKVASSPRFELQNSARDVILVDLLYQGLLDAGLIVQGKARFNSVFSNISTPVVWKGEINQLAYLINQLKENVPEIIIPIKGKWLATGNCFKIEGRPYPIPAQILKDAEPPKNTKALDAIILELSKKRATYKMKK